jgi:hypothetical protein
MKRYIVAMILAFLVPSIGSASFYSEYDWSGSKRELNTCLHRSMNEDWKLWSTQAMELWNNVSEETGWGFSLSPFLRGECDIYIVLRDISEIDYQGARLDLIDVLSGQEDSPDGYINGAVLVIDANLEITKEWIDEEQDVNDLVHDGWSTDSMEATRDPIDAIAHMLGHAMRLSHTDDYSVNLINADIGNPKNRGEHYHELSESDVSAAKASSQINERLGSEFQITYYKSYTSENVDSTFDTEAYAFSYSAAPHNVLHVNASDIAPLPIHVPEGYSHVFSAHGFYSDSELKTSALASIKYIETDLQPSDKPITEGFYTPGLLEGSIALVKFNKETWDLTPAVLGPNPSSWELVDHFELDTENNEIIFELTDFGLYGLVAIADVDQLPISMGYTRVENGELITENELIKKQSNKKMAQTALSIALPVLGGFIIGYFFARKKK